MKLKLKICGMRDTANILDVSALQPDYLGFIFYAQSPRFVGSEFEMPNIPKSVKKVGVFVNEKTDKIIRTVSEYQLDLVQLHGNETPDQCETLKAAGVHVIKFFAVDENFDFALVNPFKPYVRFFLFDTKGKYYGGNAKTFDWTLLQKYDQLVPFFLSGGISAENVKAIEKIANLNLYALDANSGVEISAAVKDINKVKELKRVADSLYV